MYVRKGIVCVKKQGSASYVHQVYKYSANHTCDSKNYVTSNGRGRVGRER